MKISDLLRRGVAAGAAAGLAAALVLYFLVEPVIRKALVIEEARGGGHAHAGEEEEPLVSRTLQVIGGMGTALVIGILFGIIFAVVFAGVRHRLPASTDHGRAVLLAGLGFTVFVLLPALKMPSNPPAVGDPETVTRRTLIYLLVILLGLLLVLGVFALDGVLRARGLTTPVRSSLLALAFVAGVTVLFVALPGTPDTVPDDVPPGLLWEFRLASLAQLGTLWAVLGLTFGMLVSRRTHSVRGAEPATV